MEASDIRWNEEARAKILDDSDRVLREAVIDLAKTRSDASSDDLVAEINARMKDRFIDFEPGPDLRKYADAIVAGEFAHASSSDATGSTGGAEARGGSRDSAGADGSGESGQGDAAAGQGSDAAVTSSTAQGGSAPLDSQNGNGVAADPGQGALAPDGDTRDASVNDG